MKNACFLMLSFSLIPLFILPLIAQDVDSLYIVTKEVHSRLYVAENREEDLARAYYLFHKAQKSGHNLQIARASEILGALYNYKPGLINKDSVIYYKKKSISKHLEIGESPRLINAYIDLGVSLKNFGDYSEGEAYLFKALKLSEKGQNKTSISNCYRILCDFCRHKKEYEEATYYGELAIAIAEEYTLNKSYKYDPLLCLITVYRKNGQAEIAIKKIDELLQFLDEEKLYNNYLYVFNERVEANIELGRIKDAIADIEKILIREGVSKEDFPNSQSSIYFYLNKEYKKAIPIYEKNIKLRIENGNLEYLLMDYPRLIDCYVNLADFENAYKRQLEFSEVIKKLNAREIKSINNELRVKYEAGQRESTIINQELRISKQNQLVNYSVGIASLLALLFIGLIYVYRNNKRKNKQLEILTSRLKEIDHFKNQLYTNITHEFRTPLTVIMGMNDNIKGHILEKKIIHRNSENLLRLVNQLLDISKLESGNLTLNLTCGNLVSYLHYLTESFYSMAQDKNIRLTFYAEEKEIIAKYDEQKIQHIIYNMLSNALKFTEEGGKVILHLKKNGTPGKSNVQIIIKDSGIGIPQDMIPHLFDRFYQADNSSTRKYEGTGIGLSLANELVKLMGGNISLESEVGVGTTFKIVLSLEEIAPNTASASSRSSMISETNINHTKHSIPPVHILSLAKTNDKPIVLIVEDNKDVMLYIRSLLQKAYQIFTAKNGQEGIEIAIEIVPDIIISDVMMPLKSGYELCQTLKQDERSSHIPIILLTAKASTTDKIEGLKFGADAYLSKPFHKEELLVRLKQLVLTRKKLQERYRQLTDQPQDDRHHEIEGAFLQKARGIIESNMQETDFGVPELTTALLMSKTQVYRKIKALTDRSPSAFIRLIRLQKAKKMLLETHFSIAEIAYAVGFSDPNYFSRCFHEEFGKPPSVLRN